MLITSYCVDNVCLTELSNSWSNLLFALKDNLINLIVVYIDLVLFAPVQQEINLLFLIFKISICNAKIAEDLLLQTFYSDFGVAED